MWGLKIWRKKIPPSPFRVTNETVPANPALEGRIGSAVWLVTLKGLDGNLIFLQTCNLYTIWFHILSFSSWLQFARLLIFFWASVNCYSCSWAIYLLCLPIVDMESWNHLEAILLSRGRFSNELYLETIFYLSGQTLWYSLLRHGSKLLSSK